MPGAGSFQPTKVGYNNKKLKGKPLMQDCHIRYSGRYIDLRERDNWEYASRVRCNGVAVIVAVTDARELVLVEQFRIPVDASVIELPAGLIGDEPEYSGESGIDAAFRELEEETGYRAGAMDTLLRCPTTAGMADEMATFYLAQKLERINAGGGDASEQICVHVVALDNIDAWLDEQASAGKMLDPKVYSALYWLYRRDI